ncbi:MAG: F0F1 ATP synthase subunit B [Lactobacillaceae bacterium]
MLSLGMESLELGDTLLLLVTLIVMIFLIGKYAYGPVNKILEDRRKKINDDLDSAQNKRKIAEKLVNQRQKEIDTSHDEVSAIIAKAKKDAEKQRIKIIEQAHQDAAAVEERSKNDLSQQKAQMMGQVKDNLVDISTKMAEQILQDQVDQEKQKQSIDDFLKKLEANK